MGANKGTFTTLDANVRVPYRDFVADITFFPFGSAAGVNPIYGHGTDRQFIPQPFDNTGSNRTDKFRRKIGNDGWPLKGTGCFRSQRNLVQILDGRIYSRVVLIHYRLSPFAVSFGNGIFDSFNGLIAG